MTQTTINELENMTLKELYTLARKYKIAAYSKLSKKELIFATATSDAKPILLQTSL